MLLDRGLAVNPCLPELRNFYRRSGTISAPCVRLWMAGSFETYFPLTVPPQERLKDKIAAAARERMVQITKEKMLQLERKRKAMLFLNMLKSSGATVHMNKGDKGDAESSNNGAVTSLPISAITSLANSPNLSPLR